MKMIKKYEIYMVQLDPVKGSEQRGFRPCMVVQHNQVNTSARTTVICPFSSVLKRFFFTLIIPSSSENGLAKDSRLDILQIRTIDQSRMGRKLGVLEKKYHQAFRERFYESFDLEDLF